MKKPIAVSILLLAALLTGCATATTEYKVFEGKGNVIEGKGGAKIIVDGMEIWDNGEPPRKFKILGIIDDQRPGTLISMSQIRSDVAKKAREAGGDAVVQINNQSQIAGYYSSGSASAFGYGNSVSAYGSSFAMPVRRNFTKFAVIKYLE